jgi:glycolate oxidase
MRSARAEGRLGSGLRRRHTRWMDALERALVELERSLGPSVVTTDLATREAHAGDESECAPHVPDAVVVARSTEDVSRTLAICGSHLVPVTPRAAGTGKSGGCIPIRGGIVLSLAALRGIDEIDAGDQLAVVRPGTVLGELRRAVEAEGLHYGPDPNSWQSCTIGGNVAENAGGPGTLRHGSTRDWVLGLTTVLPDGSVHELGRRTHKGVTGYDLTSLMVGSEGTLGVVTRVTCRLVPRPERTATLLVALGALEAVGPATNALLRAGPVRCIELLDDLTLAPLRSASPIPLPAGTEALLLVEFEGADAEVERALERTSAALDPVRPLELLVAKHAADRERIWSVRRAMSYTLKASARFKRSDDVVVPRSRLGDLLVACRRIAAQHGVRMPSYGHAGDGNLHVNFLWDEPGALPAVERAQRALFEEVIALRGTLSGEHGIGLSKRDALHLEQTPGLIELQRRIKAVFDPADVLNPGKIFPARHAC